MERDDHFFAVVVISETLVAMQLSLIAAVGNR